MLLLFILYFHIYKKTQESNPIKNDIKIDKAEQVAAYIDHTLLKPNATKEQIIQLCNEAIKYKFKAICVNPNFAKLGLETVKGTGINVAVVVGFPLGANTTRIKALETEELVELGVNEIDMVVNISALLDGDYQIVINDITEVVKASKKISQNVIVKVILECCLLTPELIVDAALLSILAGAHFVKTSTGFSTSGAKLADVQLMKQTVGKNYEVKASGGIRNYEESCKFIATGATRIGTSSGINIVAGESLQKVSY